MTEIFAARPTPLGTTVHLHVPGYQPGKKHRPAAHRAPMCGAAISVDLDTVVPLAKALQDWPMPEAASALRGPLVWSWCKPCIGHAAALAGLQAEVLAAVVAKAVPA